MMKKLGYAFLLVALILAGLLVAFAQTESGQWLVALVTLYGGAIVVGAISYDIVPGEVVGVRRLDPPTHYSAGSVRFSYQDDGGTVHEETRRVMYLTTKFRKLEIGDSIDVWVCKDDRSKVKLVGYGTYEPKTCIEKSDDGR